MKTFVLAAAVMAASCAAAEAQSVTVADACKPLLPAAQKFDHNEHRLWYNRFWTGDCSTLGFWCQPGSPNWIEAMADLVEQAPAGRKPELVTKLCQVGHLVGLDWARDNNIRKIDTNELRKFYEMLNSGGGDAFSRLAAVEAKARAELGQ
jgi:hypothetical protein